MADLAPRDLDRWLELRASNAKLDSPYFHPGFTAAVASTHPAIRLIVGEDPLDGVTSFLPVQLDSRGCRPAGSPAADFQGPICASGTEFDIAAAIEACGISSYRFDHLWPGAAGFEPWTAGSEQSPFVDVSGGMDGYLTRASRSGRDNLAQARRLGRKAQREQGPLRFVAASADPALLDCVIALKRRQYRSTGSRDYFSHASHVHLVHRLLRSSGRDFGGMLSAVYAGPHLLAAHFGLRAGSVLHWWFPVYNPEFSRLAPGWLLLRALIEAAPQLGVARIDLGRGRDEYKRRAMTGYQVVCQGVVIRNPLRRHVAHVRSISVEAVKSSALAPALRGAIRYARSRSR